jgi:hypothetical protein
LLDRAVVDHLEARERRDDDAELEQRFAERHASALGALCFLAHRALQSVRAANVPAAIRMREPARFATAAETAAGFPAGAVAYAYLKSRDHAAQVATHDPVVAALLDLVRPGDEWRGTAAQLLARNRVAPGFPQTPRGVRSSLDRNCQALRDLGIDLQLPTEDTRTGHERNREVVIRRRHGDAPTPQDSLSLFFSGKSWENRPHRPQSLDDTENERTSEQTISAAGTAPIRPHRSDANGAVSSADIPNRPPRPSASNGPQRHAVSLPPHGAAGRLNGFAIEIPSQHTKEKSDESE